MKTKKSILPILFSAALLIIFLSWNTLSAYSANTETQGSILYVIPGANSTCSSWEDACELQTALSIATAGDQIWVAAGTYKPTADTNRYATFQLKTGVAIYGGFPVGGGAWETRDWKDNLTTLSGDIGNLDDSADNSYHVVTGSGVDATAILDGFTISDGFAEGSGGGMYNSSGSPSLSNVIFSGNSAGYFGGGMYNYYSSLSLTNVKFSGNSAGYFGGGIYNDNSSPSLTNVAFRSNSTAYDGGGMYNYNSSPSLSNVTFSDNSVSFFGGGMTNWYSSPRLSNVTFRGNSAAFYGGGIYNANSSPSLTNVTFSSNYADYDGGGMYNDGSSPSMSNVTFSSNSAGYFGGGMINWDSSSPSLSNVTFSNNLAGYYGGGIYNDGGIPTITNTIIWGNTPDQISGTATVTYSDIQGGYPGTGNINANPLLGPLTENGGFTQTHALGDGSPAIDAGDPAICPNIDQRAYARPIDGDGNGTATCDMGAYEYASYPATFFLTLDVIGSGSVGVNPEKKEYLWKESVTLTPFADPGWVFKGWSGDASGSDNPLTISIEGDTTVTAIFLKDWIYLPLIAR